MTSKDLETLRSIYNRMYPGMPISDTDILQAFRLIIEFILEIEYILEKDNG